MDESTKTMAVCASQARANGEDPVPSEPVPQGQRQAGRPQRRAERQAPLRAGCKL